MVSRQASVSEPRHVAAALRPVLEASGGWRARGYPIRQPRTGWYAERSNASFSLALANLTMPTAHLTVLSLKSDAPEWANSTLSVRIQVDRVGRPGPPGGGEREEGAGKSGKSGDGDVGVFAIDGHHGLRTSVHFPHKLRVPGGPALAGDAIRADFSLVSGSAFKIAGIAFCRT
jgi:hypothetical protein